jgi:hypothetical protein
MRLLRKIKYFLFLFAFLIPVLGVILTYHPEKPREKSVDILSLNEKLIRKLGFLNIHDSVKHTGTDKCIECHTDVYQDYQHTGMGKSWRAATPEESDARFDRILYDPESDYYYKPYWSGKQMMVLEYRLDNGDTVYKRTVRIDYIVGSGQHTNSHIRNINGYLFQVPFTYYTQEGILDFPPGFERGNNARFSRPIGFECITCHNAYPDPYLLSVNKYKEVPLSINCERCHGPGELHVKAMQEGKVVETQKYTDFTIVNPKRLPPALQNELCARCHNQGNMILHEGKTFFDFRPGMYVSDILEAFREKYENDEEAFWMETHPERMSRSKCYTETLNNPDYKPLSCIDCHFTSNLRHFTYKETPIDSFNSYCIRCHSEMHHKRCSASLLLRNSYKDNCIHCHMPKTGTFDIPHVIITDHHIRITDKWKEKPKNTYEIKTGTFLGLKCMSNPNPSTASWAKAYLSHYEKFLNNPAMLDSARFYLKNLDREKHFNTWAYYYYLSENYAALIEFSKHKSSGELKADIAYYIGQSYYNHGRYKEAREYYQRAADAMPYELNYRNKLGTSFITLGLYEEAKKEFAFIIAENPEMPIALNNLAFVYLFEKNFEKADMYIRKALSIDPDYVNAHLNKVKILFALGKFSEADTYLHRLKKKYPANRDVKQLLELKNRYLSNEQ